MNAYSEDLRIRVLAAVDRGTPRAEIARVFGVSLATIGRYVRRRRESGGISPLTSPGRTPSICRTAEEGAALWQQLEDNRTATLQRHCELWEQKRGVRVSISTMSRAVRRLGWTYKNRAWTPPNDAKKHAALNGKAELVNSLASPDGCQPDTGSGAGEILQRSLTASPAASLSS